MNEPGEIERILAAAIALGLDSPIIDYRIVGERIELWTVHGGPFIYEQAQVDARPRPAPVKKNAIRIRK